MAARLGRSNPFARPAVDYLYSLYDALVSINVPSDKARAVVDAMERDMGTTLATKQDLAVLKAELEAKLTSGLASVRNQLLTAQVAAFFGIIL